MDAFIASLSGTVTGRQAGESALSALRRAFTYAAADADPVACAHARSTQRDGHGVDLLSELAVGEHRAGVVDGGRVGVRVDRRVQEVDERAGRRGPIAGEQRVGQGDSFTSGHRSGGRCLGVY